MSTENRPASGAAIRPIVLEDLRPRQRQIAELLLQYHRVPAIAERLAISPHTVRNHLKSLYRRMQVRSQQELLLLLAASANRPGAPE